jgi:hypothetical protein
MKTHKVMRGGNWCIFVVYYNMKRYNGYYSGFRVCSSVASFKGQLNGK